MNKLQITMTTEQARIIKVALEEYFRSPLGQWRALADRLAFRGFDWGNHTDEELDKRCEKKEYALYAFDAAGNIVMGRTETIPRPTDEAIAPEVWVAYLVYVIIAEALFTVHYLGRYSGLA